MYTVQFKPNVSFQSSKRINDDSHKIEDALSKIRKEFTQKSLPHQNIRKTIKLSLKKMQLVNLSFEADFKKDIAVLTTAAGMYNKITGSVTKRMTIAEMKNFLQQKNNPGAMILNFIEHIRYSI